MRKSSAPNSGFVGLRSCSRGCTWSRPASLRIGIWTFATLEFLRADDARRPCPRPTMLPHVLGAGLRVVDPVLGVIEDDFLWDLDLLSPAAPPASLIASRMPLISGWDAANSACPAAGARSRCSPCPCWCPRGRRDRQRCAGAPARCGARSQLGCCTLRTPGSDGARAHRSCAVSSSSPPNHRSNPPGCRLATSDGAGPRRPEPRGNATVPSEGRACRALVVDGCWLSARVRAGGAGGRRSDAVS